MAHHFQTRSPLTRSKFMIKLCTVLSEVGIDCSKYSSHSFRIRAAKTAAVTRGIQDSLDRTLQA